jgi:hypothetical protein
MVEIYPSIKSEKVFCPKCNNLLQRTNILWQGVHIVSDCTCSNCSKSYLVDLPVHQATTLFRILDKGTKNIYNDEKCLVNNEAIWLNEKITTILEPSEEYVELEIDKRLEYKKVIILNTIDYVYGHSLLTLLNIQRILKITEGTDIGLIVIIQPMMKWLVPELGVAEIWTANLTFNKAKKFYNSLSNQINEQLTRFETCSLSRGHLLPTNEKINIKEFVKVSTYNFTSKPQIPRITFIWREDAGRLWIRNIYLLKIMQKSGLYKILLPIQLFKLKLFFKILRRKLQNTNYQLTVAGLGKYGTFNKHIEDQRVEGFSLEEELRTCKIYSESELVIGVHGSSMLLPSGLAGMTVSMMPSKRWGNFAEDVIFTAEDPRLTSFQQRIIPLNLSLREIIDICTGMINGRPYFVKKFIHNEDL